VPATVQAVLAARIDRLPAEEKHLLQTAAVIGTEVPLPLLQAIAELPEAALHGGLAHLHAAEFLYETHLFPEHEYTFKHALTQQVAYSSVLQERRRMLHTHIVEALEALAGDRVAEQVERLAHHSLQGEVWDKALAYCRQAGEKAMTRSAHHEAVEALEQALTLARDHQERGNEAYALRLLGDIAAHRAPPDVDRAAAHYRQALVLAEELGMRPLQAHCHRGLGTLYGAVGQREQARAALTTAIEMYRAMDMTFWLPQAEGALAQVEGR
jgi:predicted ATPase